MVRGERVESEMVRGREKVECGNGEDCIRPKEMAMLYRVCPRKCLVVAWIFSK